MNRGAAIAALTAALLALASAHAGARGVSPIRSAEYARPDAPPHWRRGAPAYAARWVWSTGSALVAEASRYVGSGKFTAFPGAWCADAVSFWLERIGKPPLASRMAAAALAYGPRVADPQPGDLAVMRTNRGPYGHVGVVAGVGPDGAIAIISGNWGGRVARSVISRASVTAFVRTSEGAIGLVDRIDAPRRRPLE